LSSSYQIDLVAVAIEFSTPGYFNATKNLFCAVGKDATAPTIRAGHDNPEVKHPHSTVDFNQNNVFPSLSQQNAM